MTTESAIPSQVSQTSPQISLHNCYSQIRLKTEGEKLLLILPPETTQEATNNGGGHLWQELKSRLVGSVSSWSEGTNVHLIAKDRLLDGRQLQAIAEILKEVKLQLKCVSTSRRQTAVAAASAGYSVEQETAGMSLVNSSQTQQLLAEPLYLLSTVRSGVEIRHPGTVVIQGDVNPGGIVIAAGDILVWGALRGIAHAGANGSRECRIMALRLEPTQLRIADVVARAPESVPEDIEAEVAYITKEGIRIARAVNFVKTHSFSSDLKSWTEQK